jgi:putative ABC transport system permease protein
MTVALLAGAGLLVRSARNLASVKAGFDTERILAVTVTEIQRDRWLDFHTRALTRVASLPGVEHVAFAWGVPLTGNKWPGEIEQPGLVGSNKATDRINVPLRSVTPDYFAVFGIPLAEGRSFRDTDKEGAPRVAIVNQTFARRYFQGQPPLGRSIQFPGDKSGAITVVGVVADTRTDSLSQPAQPEIYFPFWQFGAFSKHLVLRASGDPAELAETVQRELRAIDSTSSVEHMTTMVEIRRESMAPWLFAMRLLTAFAFAATFLALVGVYGVLSLSVASRVKELGVRKAIGAQGRQIVGLVVGEGSRLIAIGLIFGTIGALLLGRVLEALLFEVTATDPLALAGSAAMFGVVALAVCLVPAMRAQRVNVVEALRQE